MLMNVFITTFGISGGRHRSVMDFGASSTGSYQPVTAATTVTPRSTTLSTTMALVGKILSGVGQNSTENL